MGKALKRVGESTPGSPQKLTDNPGFFKSSREVRPMLGSRGQPPGTVTKLLTSTLHPADRRFSARGGRCHVWGTGFAVVDFGRRGDRDCRRAAFGMVSASKTDQRSGEQAGGGPSSERNRVQGEPE